MDDDCISITSSVDFRFGVVDSVADEDAAELVSMSDIIAVVDVANSASLVLGLDGDETFSELISVQSDE